MTDRVEVFDLDPGEEVGCYFCMAQGGHQNYGRGEAFLAGPDHPPYDANANYICKDHLDPDVVIVSLPPLLQTEGED